MAYYSPTTVGAPIKMLITSTTFRVEEVMFSPLSVCVCVCVCPEDFSKTSLQICMISFAYIAHEPGMCQMQFGGNPPKNPDSMADLRIPMAFLY